MENTIYVEMLIDSTDKIYMDTSSLMNVPELKILINSISCKLKEAQKTITIPQAVFMELACHSVSDDKRKRDLAIAVIEILSEHKDIFSLESEKISPDCLIKNFADAKLLAELTENKSAYRQLLITNDRNLSLDAFELNNLESCKGHKIKVCYLNKYGELHRCSCVSKSAEPEIKVVEKEVIKYVYKDNDSNLKKTGQIFIPTLTFVLGYLAGNKKVISNFKKLF